MSVSNVVSIVLPAVCLIGGGLAVWSQVRRISDLRAERLATERSIGIVQQELASVEGTSPMARIPTMEMTPKEQVDFLYSLRAYASATRVRIVSWTNGTPLAPVGPVAKAQSASSLPAGVKPISSAITVGGTYSDLREFLYYLLRSPRLLSMSDMRWARGEAWPASSVSFTLTRYVTPPLSAEAAAGADVSAAPTSGGAPLSTPGGSPVSPVVLP